VVRAGDPTSPEVAAGSPTGPAAGSSAGSAGRQRPPGAGGPAGLPGEGSYAGLLGVLNVHGQALVRGDERGWLAVVDPARADTVDYFGRLFDTLRAMRVSSWTYQRSRVPPPFPAPSGGVVSADVEVDVGYCLITTPCPDFQPLQTIGPVAGAQPAHVRLRIKAEHRDGRWRVTDRLPSRARAWAGSDLPWQEANLRFASTPRVTVAAAPSQAARLPAVLAAADRAAVLTDRYRRFLPTDRHRYLLFLAGADEWRTWYGGGPTGAAGYAMPRGSVGVDVVIDMTGAASGGRAPAGDRLLELLRHEFGHAITMHGVPPTDLQYTELLEEGIAEYIAHAPRPATASDTMGPVRRWARRADFPRTTLANLPQLPASATGERRAAYYGLGHLLADCLARRYGQAKLFHFYTRTVREKMFDEPASRAAFGRPWRTVERRCLTDIRTATNA
jgi:hypothetical protein